MGQSSSNSRRNDYHRQNPSFPYSSPPPGPNQSATSSSHLPLPPLLPPPSQPPPPPRSNYSTPYPMPSPPSPTTSYYHQSSTWTCRPPYPQHYGPGRSGGWWTTPPPPPPINSPGMAGQPPALPPPPFVEQTKTVKNDVNVHKDSIRLVPDEQNLDHHLVSFTFDAMVDGRYLILIAIFFITDCLCHFQCMCGECAKALRLQSNKCPICRQPVEQLMEIKVDTADP
ncbi:hypothetical protein B296_00052670 [Ensete ventricosum]|uniref:RING-type E3 ubiquitin transferase n=1 Tax=Ensete ventricosum TaxID=4639 RepID=A0A426YBA3_ENSVE|nr:hypothetical protein B296_00052670 [Ensete ventricosum]